MVIAATATLSTAKNNSILYNGPFEETFPQMRKDGFRAVELHILDSRKLNREVLYRLLRENELTLTSIGTGSVYFDRGYSLTDPDAFVRRACIDHMREHMITAMPYGGVIIIGCVQGRIGRAMTESDFRSRMTESLLQLDKLAGVYGVKIGFEIMNRFESDMFRTIDETLPYFKECGFAHTVMHIDTVHLNIEEADIGKAIRLGANWIGHVHVADNDRWYPGHAHYNFAETFSALRDIGYKGALALETRPLPDSSYAGKRSLEFLNTFL